MVDVVAGRETPARWWLLGNATVGAGDDGGLKQS